MWISIKDYAEKHNCSTQHVRNMIKAGLLTVKDISVGSKKCLRIKDD